MSNANRDKVQDEFDGEHFNIMHFIMPDDDYETGEDASSMISPASSSGSSNRPGGNQVPGMHPHQHPQHQQQSHRQGGQQPNAIFQTRRLLDSPANTDRCGNSSSSSSHQSDPMFSPNEFNNYNGANNNSTHPILQQLTLDQNMGQPPRSNASATPLLAQHLQQTPQNFWSQGGGQAPSQAPSNASMKYSGAMNDIYSLLQGNDIGLASPELDEPSNRKRSRMVDTPSLQNFVNNMSGVDAFADENYNHQQAIKFSKFQEGDWNTLYDINGGALSQLQVHVIADKGFNYSNTDNCFVNQKKNHFQVSINVEASDAMPPKYVQCNGSLVPIRDFKLAFSGVKAEMPSSEVTIRQSRADRKPHPHTPVVFEVHERRLTKVTVPRLHFSETTMNNQRKNFRPNPDQKYFLLVVRLFASISDDHSVLIQSYASEKVIVRATNPGSFEPPDSDVAWQRNGGTLYTPGSVAIGTDRQIDSARLAVAGDLYVGGRIINPSDIRLKEAIAEKESLEAIENVLKLRVVDYRYKPEVADLWGLDENGRQRTGLIAQELAAVLPDAVRDIGDYFTIDESRVFYETVMAMQQLCRMTGDLDHKIDEKVAEISKRLSEYARRKKLASSCGSNLNAENRSLALSRLSLTSTATNVTGAVVPAAAASRRQPTRRERAFRAAQTIGNKLSQGTIVTLVSVMAACLLAMSALYVLDWHNRNYGYHQNFDANATPTKGEPANLVVSPSDYMPSFQPDAPVLLDKCWTTKCKTYCCVDKPPAIEEPKAAGAIATHGLHNGEDMPAPSDQSPNKTTADRAPIVEHLGFGTGVEIRIPILNVTIDQRYCIERSCHKRKGIYNLYIPVSRFMPSVPIEIEIKTPVSKVIGNCGAHPDFAHKLCPLANQNQQSMSQVPTSTRIFENLFEVAAGRFIQSAYRFRVGWSTETCYSEDANGEFEEYNLIFYRMCTLSSS